MRNLEKLVFEKGKSENPEKNVSEQRSEPAKTNSTHKWHLRRDRTPHWTPQFFFDHVCGPQGRVEGKSQ